MQFTVNTWKDLQDAARLAESGDRIVLFPVGGLPVRLTVRTSTVDKPDGDLVFQACDRKGNAI
jgi:hypothetical protein